MTATKKKRKPKNGSTAGEAKRKPASKPKGRKPESNDDDVGLKGLKRLGVRQVEQLALLFPQSWDDNRSPVALGDAVREPARHVLVECVTIPKTVSHSFVAGRPVIKAWVTCSKHPRYRCAIQTIGDEAEYNRWVSLFDTVNPKPIFLRGEVQHRQQGTKTLARILVGEFVPGNKTGMIYPRYAGRSGAISAATVNARMDQLLSEVDKAFTRSARWLLDTILEHENISGRTGLPRKEAKSVVLLIIARLLGVLDDSRAGLVKHLAKQIELAHGLGVSPHADMDAVKRIAERAQALIARLASVSVYMRARQNIPPAAAQSSFCTPGDWRVRAAQHPFTMTGEQVSIVSALIGGIRRGRPIRALISGDVGTGKTAVFSTVAASVMDGGGRVVILLPSQTLARQVFEEITGTWPDFLDGKTARLVLSEGAEPEGPAPLTEALLLVGTTALLHRDVGSFDLSVVDEQQKTGTAQREQLVSETGSLIECTATCIPRTQALTDYGAINIFRLTQDHCQKTIHTRIVGGSKEESRELMQRVRDVISKGGKVLAVYPAREDNPTQPRISAAGMLERWEKIAPGRVRLAHGGLTPEENAAAIADTKAGRADILVSTTIVEVGITIPALTMVIVVQAEYYGLSALHQIRGRLVRHGGTGYFDMILNENIANYDKAGERLDVLVKTTNGFEIAEYDLALRGSGDISRGGREQKGTDHNILPGRYIKPSEVDDVIHSIRELNSLVKQRVAQLQQGVAQDL